MSDAFRTTPLILAIALAACLAAGCDRDPPDASSADPVADAGALPRPEAGAGSVTGFDGNAPPPPSPASPADDLAQGPDTPDAGTAADDAGFDLDSPQQDGSDTGIPPTAVAVPPATPAPPPQNTTAEPAATEAAAVVRSYYGAINAGQYPRAYRLWSDGGGASGQTADQFAGGFSDTAKVTVSTGAPGRVEGAAGSRYVRIPVAVEAVQHDGTIRHYDGTYTLRRAVVDGATAEQRQWRISDADLREVE